jgi:hypothetical protein
MSTRWTTPFADDGLAVGLHVYTLMDNRQSHIAMEGIMDTAKVGLREFRAGLAEYIASHRPVAVTRHRRRWGTSFQRAARLMPTFRR